MEKKKIIHASNTLVFESILVINVREGDDLKSLIYRDCKIPTLQVGIRAESAIWNASQAAISPFSQCVLLPRCNEYAFEEFRLIETSPTFVAREKKKKSIVSIAREKEERNERKKDRRRDCCSPRFLVQRKLGDSLPPRDDPLGARRPWAGTDPRAWRRIGRVLWRSCPRGPGDSSCTCADNSARRPRRSIPASQPGSPRLRASSATGGTSSPSGTSGSKGPGRPATRAPAWSRSESLGRPIRTIFAGPGTVGKQKRKFFLFVALLSLVCRSSFLFRERGDDSSWLSDTTVKNFDQQTTRPVNANSQAEKS